MTSLADELMNDLDDLGSGSEEEDSAFATGTHAESSSSTQPPLSTTSIKEEEASDEEGDVELSDEMYRVPEGGIKPAEELDQDQVDRMDLASIGQVNKVAKLYGGKTLKDVLQVSLVPFDRVEGSELILSVLRSSRKSIITSYIRIQTSRVMEIRTSIN